jgi:hypothetical protein
VLLTFSVERAVKGRIGDTIEVETANNGSACGIETTVGGRIGLFLEREGDTWTGHLCWQVAPEDLLAAASLPAPNGHGPVALLVGGRFGPARTLALDLRGHTLAYGFGAGSTSLLSTCPGGRQLAEIAPVRSDTRMRPTYEVAIRETSSMRITRRQTLKLPGWRFATGLLCEGAAGTSVVIFANVPGDAPNGAAMYRLANGRVTAIWKGAGFLSSFKPRIAYLNAGRLTDQLVSVDLHTGRVRALAWLPRSPRLAADRTGRRLAGVAYLLSEKSRIVLVDLTTRPPRIRSTPLGASDVSGTVLWVSDRRMVFLPSDRRETARLLDLRLRTLSRFRWTAGDAALVGSTLVGIHDRALVTAKLPAGRTRLLRGLPGEPTVIVAAAG